MSEDTNLEPSLHSLCIPQGGWAEDFWADLKLFFLERHKGGFAKILDRRGGGGGVAIFFLTYLKRKHYFLEFFFYHKKAILITLCLKKVS